MKIGLFFGSFNPIHIGHMAIANYMLEFTDLEKLWFVVSPQNPFKKRSNLLDENHRLVLVNSAIEDNYKFKASNIEFSMPKPSYTIDTLVYLNEKYPDNDFVLIMGSDNLRNLKKWKNYETILENHEIFVYPRPGDNNLELMAHEKVSIVNAPLMEISSSFIRNAIKDKKDVRYFMPDKVAKYVGEMHFYEISLVKN